MPPYPKLAKPERLAKKNYRWSFGNVKRIYIRKQFFKEKKYLQQQIQINLCRFCIQISNFLGIQNLSFVQPNTQSYQLYHKILKRHRPHYTEKKQQQKKKTLLNSFNFKNKISEKAQHHKSYDDYFLIKIKKKEETVQFIFNNTREKRVEVYKI